jgi:hypothetical protein
MEFSEHVRSKRKPKRETDEVEVVVRGNPEYKLEKEGVGLAHEEQDDQNCREEQRAHT